jgi:3-dehydroquinate synthase
MLESFEVTTSGGKYTVNIGEGLFSSIEPKKHAIYLIDDYHLSSLRIPAESLIAISALESSKSLDYMSGVIERMRELGANRDTHVYAIGGGIIQDIATFVNSIYMRGLSWTYLPSTLLSMADSCIGGKSSINVRGYKNLVGNIYPPSEVFVDMDFCKTLGPDEVIGGLAEAVKICYARGTEVFNQYLQLDPVYPLIGESGVKVVFSSLLAKKWFIEVDEFDQSERLLLNYGHTFGHALEASSNFEITHGVAVALGMLVATQYAKMIGNLSGVGKSSAECLDGYLVRLLSPLQADVKSALQKIDMNTILSKFEGDKKHRHTEYRMVLPASEGGLVLFSSPKDETTRLLIEKAYRQTFSTHGYLN